jgi:HD-GYP domain-containing protein (c-di-GMP phosphodiesterase class II)
MTSDRPYRKAMSHHEAYKELEGNAGTQFDPEVIEAFLGVLGRREPTTVPESLPTPPGAAAGA